MKPSPDKLTVPRPSSPGPQAGGAGPAGGHARWALASLCLTMLMPSLDTSIANAGLPTLARAFGASFQAVQWIVLAYLLAITTLIVSVGRLGDLLGRRRLLLGGVALFTLASLLCGAAPTLGLLIAARAAQGLGAAVMMALTVALVGEAVPKAKTGSAMGLLGTMSAIGTTLGPSLGGVLMAGLGWRSIFFVNVPLGIINIVLAGRFLPADHPAPAGIRFDIPGTVLLALALAAYALAMTLGHGHFGRLNLGLLGAAALGMAAFVAVEARVASPLLRLAMFRDRALCGSLAMIVLVMTVICSTLVVGPFYLAHALGLKTALVGFVLSGGPVVSALAGVPAGRIVDRFGAPRMTLLGLACLIAGASALALQPLRAGVPGYMGAVAVLTAGYALFQAANNTAIMMEVRPEQRGLVSGMLSLARNLGLVTGVSVMGAVFALAVGTVDVGSARPQAVAHGLGVTFAVAVVLMLLALGIAAGAWRRGRTKAVPPVAH